MHAPILVSSNMGASIPRKNGDLSKLFSMDVNKHTFQFSWTVDGQNSPIMQQQKVIKVTVWWQRTVNVMFKSKSIFSMFILKAESAKKENTFFNWFNFKKY